MFDTICLSGGGVKGLTFIGALEYLENINFINLNKINNWVGTSAGAITCFLLTLGYTISEIRNFILDFNFKMLEPSININNLLELYGIDLGTKLMYTLGEFLKSKLNVNDITFEKHYKITNCKLSVIGTNFSKGTETIFNYEKYPKMSVLTAIRISLSIPIFFTPVLYDSDYYVDGAVVNNFPINYCNLETTFGIYVTNNETGYKLNNIIDLISGCINITIDTISLKHLINNTFNILKINNNLKLTNFNLDREQKLKLLEIGMEAATEYINNLPRKIAIFNINNIVNKIINKLTIH
jgi:NTE family protein